MITQGAERATAHTLHMRSCMTYVTAAIQGEGDVRFQQLCLAYAMNEAAQASAIADSRIELMAAQYMENFVKDMRVMIRQAATAGSQSDGGMLEKN